MQTIIHLQANHKQTSKMQTSKANHKQMQTIIHLQANHKQTSKMQTISAIAIHLWTISAIAINCGTFIQMLAIVFNHVRLSLIIVQPNVKSPSIICVRLLKSPSKCSTISSRLLKSPSKCGITFNQWLIFCSGFFVNRLLKVLTRCITI